MVRGSLRVGTPPEDGDLVVRSLAEAAWGIYCSAEYAEAHGMPIDPQQLSNHPLLGFEGFLADAPAGQWIREHGAKSLPAGQSNNLVNHLQAVKAGIGVGALPRIEGDSHLDLRICIPDMTGASQTVWLVMRRDARKDKAVSELADLVIARVSALKRQFAGSPRSKH